MFPLKNRKLIRGAVAHVKAGLGVAADYEAVYIPFYVPFDGKVETYRGTEGGKWFRLTRDDNGDKIELAHNSAYEIKSGHAREGQLGGITGNTGTITTGPHSHIQIIDKAGNRLDPETYDWETIKTTFMKVTIVANKITWDIEALLPTLSNWFKIHSSNRLEVVFDFKRTNFDNIPLSPFGDMLAVDITWYRENITPLATGEMTLLVLNPDQYNTAPYNTWGFMTYGDVGKPVRAEVSCYDDPNYPEAHLFVHRAFHEICHAFPFLTEQPDRVHEFLLQNPPKRTELLDLIDYPKLQAKLLTIKPTSMAKYYKVNDHGKLGIMILEGFSGTIIFENEYADYQDLIRITEGTENAPTINIP